MEFEAVTEVIELLEKANTNLEPELLPRPAARRLLAAYARAEKLAAFGVAALARKLDNPSEVALTTGTSVGKAKETVATGKTLAESEPLSDAMRRGKISLDQASEIASAERSAPGAARELLPVAKRESFQVLRDKARKVKLEAEQHRDLAARQHKARCGRHYSDELGMVHVHLAFEPHIGTPIVNRAEADAARLLRAAKKTVKGDGAVEAFECYLADAYAAMLSARSSSGPGQARANGSAANGSGKGTATANGNGRARKPELIILVSHEVTKRGWKDVRPGEVCKIPGIGPVAPSVAREIASDAFLTGVFYDGRDLRHLRRWTRNTPVEVLTALQLGKPPDFDGVRCLDCGNRFGIQNDHVEPHVAKGPASVDNFEWRCWPCHQAKTKRDRKAGKLKSPET